MPRNDANHLNTPRLIADSTGTAVWRWDQQEPFGVSPADENPSGLGVFKFPLRHPGQYDDPETGLFYNYLRDCYDPATGRYCQADPIGFAGGSLSLYAYVDSSPLRFIDPLGLQAIPVPVTPPIAGPNSGGSSNIAKALNNLINKIIEACKPDDGACPPCKLIDGTVVAVGTIAYRPMDTPAPGKSEHGISGAHFNLYKANQAPRNSPQPCKCFWQSIGAVPPPPQPNWIPIQPFMN
jgi:RHS repeat-associated protein